MWIVKSMFVFSHKQKKGGQIAAFFCISYCNSVNITSQLFKASINCSRRGSWLQYGGFSAYLHLSRYWRPVWWGQNPWS